MACRAFGPHNGKGLRESIGIFCALMGFKELEKRSGRFEKKEDVYKRQNRQLLKKIFGVRP